MLRKILKEIELIDCSICIHSGRGKIGQVARFSSVRFVHKGFRIHNIQKNKLFLVYIMLLYRQQKYMIWKYFDGYSLKVQDSFQ